MNLISLALLLFFFIMGCCKYLPNSTVFDGFLRGESGFSGELSAHLRMNKSVVINSRGGMINESESQQGNNTRNNFLNVVYNSRKATLEQFSHHVQIHYMVNGHFLCAGVVVHPNFILSMAHCLQNVATFDTDLFKVLIGSTIRKEGALLTVTKIIINPKYLLKYEQQLEHENQDIALLFVPDPIPNRYILEISTQNENPGQIGYFSGFGRANDKNDGTQYPLNLQYAELSVLAGMVKEAPSLFFTTGKTGGGDSGGSLIFKDRNTFVLGGLLVGTLEGGYNHPEFIRVKDFKEWIDTTILNVMKDEANKKEEEARAKGPIHHPHDEMF